VYNRTRARFVPVAVGLAAAVCAPALHAQQTYDVIVRDARILDGTGNPWVRADIGIRGDRIAAVGRIDAAAASVVIDGTGLYAAPGFIDTHSHAGSGLASAALSHARPLLAQGVTTVIVNPDGGGPIDLRAQRDALTADPLGVNVGLLVPHGSVRRAVIGMHDRAPDADELERMRGLVRAGMDAGAFGLSSGLYYAPGSYATTEEVIALASVAAEYGGVYQSHLRDESDYTVGVVAALDELIRIARDARIRSVATHLKALGPHLWGYSGALITRIERARAAGIEVFADVYPYEASSTGVIGALVPRWAIEGGWERLQDRLRHPGDRERLRRAVVANLERRGGPHRLVVTNYVPDSTIGGQDLASLAAARGLEAADLVLTLLEAGDAGLISYNMSPDDVAGLLAQPWTMTASDGLLVLPSDRVHPRSYGTFPRRIRAFTLERGISSLAEAVRSMTALPAAVFGIHDRGILRPGAYADVVLFDLETLSDPATFDDPHQLATGVRYLIVNGRLALDDGRFAAPGHGVVLDARAR
jgi:N-acyl-D-aspartate/D-glutamate deacylase